MRVEFYGGVMDGAVREMDTPPPEVRVPVGQPRLRPWDIRFHTEPGGEWIYDLVERGESWRYELRRA